MEFRFSQHDTYSEVFARVSAAIGNHATNKTRVRLALEASNGGELIYKAVIEDSGNKRSLNRLELSSQSPASSMPFQACRTQKPDARQENWEVFQRLLRNELLKGGQSDDASQLKFVKTIEYITQLVCEQPKEVSKGFKYNWLSDLNDVVQDSEIAPDPEGFLEELQGQQPELTEEVASPLTLEGLQEEYRIHEADYEKYRKKTESMHVLYMSDNLDEDSTPLSYSNFNSAYWALHNLSGSQLHYAPDGSSTDGQSRLNERGEMDISGPLNEEDAPSDVFRRDDPEFEGLEKLVKEAELETVLQPLLNRVIELNELGKTRETERNQREEEILLYSEQLRQQLHDFKQDKIWRSHVTSSQFNWQIASKKEL